jgi:cytochrome c553
MGLESTLSNPSFQQTAISNVSNAAPKTAPSGGGANAANAIAQFAEVGISVATTIAGVHDERLRAKFEQNLALLSNDQQLTLAKAINNAQSEDERLRIMTQVLTSLSNQRISNIESLVAEQEKNKRNDLLVKAGIFVVLGGVLIYVLSRNK